MDKDFGTKKILISGLQTIASPKIKKEVPMNVWHLFCTFALILSFFVLKVNVYELKKDIVALQVENQEIKKSMITNERK